MQDHMVEMRVGSMAMPLPVLGMWIYLYIAAQALAVQFYFRAQKIRAGSSVSFAKIQDTQAPMALGFSLRAQHSGMP